MEIDQSKTKMESTPRAYSDQDVKKAAFIVSFIGLIFMAILILMVIYLPSSQNETSPHPIGIVAVAGAIVIFGSCGITFKTPSLQSENVEPLVFQLYNAMGIAMVSFPLMLVLISQNLFRFEPLGIIAAVDIIVTSAFCFAAVQRIGYAVAPAIWAGTGMVVSFCWGVAVFAESIINIYIAVLSIVFLTFGVFGVASNKRGPVNRDSQCGENFSLEKGLEQSSQIEAKDDSDPAPIGVETKSSPKPARRSHFLKFGGIGVTYCLCAGLCDGSLMVPYKLQEITAPRNDFTNTLNYLASFGIGTVITIPAIILFFNGLIKRSFPDLKWKVAAFPGIMSGVLWGMANFLSVHATRYLGISVGFPLTQTCICINALWGIFFFKEVHVQNRRFLFQFSFSICIILLGASLLAQYG